MSEFHPSFWAALTGWFLAQLIKMISCFVRSGKLDFSYLMSTGGMPSAHTSMVCSLTTSIGLYEGFSTPLFSIGVCFASVVMFDAQSVRKAAGEQAKLLNQIVDELLHEHHLSEQKLKELLGHTRLEVLGGVLSGIGAAHLVYYIG
jgi:acid phosphatase family membrane protein YuiD